MHIRQINELIFLCKKAGFKTLAEVLNYMKKEGINANRLYDELDALCFPEYISCKK